MLKAKFVVYNYVNQAQPAPDFIGTSATLRVGSPFVFSVQIYEFRNERPKSL